MFHCHVSLLGVIAIAGVMVAHVDYDCADVRCVLACVLDSIRRFLESLCVEVRYYLDVAVLDTIFR